MGFLSEESIAFFNEFYGNQISEKPMAQQTAAEWFTERITHMVHEAYDLELADLYEQAKEMEKEQIESAFSEGKFNGINMTEYESEQYYTQTYTTRLQNETN
jgi:hypothetical protein